MNSTYYFPEGRKTTACFPLSATLYTIVQQGATHDAHGHATKNANEVRAYLRH